MQNELLTLGLDSLNSKIENLREIYFSLNDYTADLVKTYFLTFDAVKDGYVKVSLKENQDKIQLFLSQVPIVVGREFYLKKGTYQIKVQVNLQENNSVEIAIKGYVKYHDNSNVKVLNEQDFSVISVQNNNQISLFKYDGQIALIENLTTKCFDFYLDNAELYLFYITEKGFCKKLYLQGLNDSIVQEIEVDNLTEIKCYKGEKVGLYGVKGGILHKIDIENFTFTSLNFKVKNLLTVGEDCVVIKDNDNKIKLCNFAVS